MSRKRIGTTGPAYSLEEEAILMAGAKLGRSARQIAAALPDRTRASVYSKALAMGLNLSSSLTISQSGQLGVRANNETERAQWQAKINLITANTKIDTFKELWESALHALYEKVKSRDQG